MRSRVAPLWPLLANLAFVTLAIFNSLRLFRHAMWLDEMQAFLIAAASSTPLDLFAKLKYESHPGLWHLLLWVITRFTDNPVSMQVAQFVIALGIWILIWRIAPFRPIEKLLLLLSFYLFWEYFVLSRSYSLGVLLAFGFVALYVHRPEQRFWPWVLLGLLANTTVFGTIWSFGLGGLFVFSNRRDWRALLPGFAIFVTLVVLAVVTMLPAPDSYYAKELRFVFRGKGVLYVIGAFLPMFWPFVGATLDLLGSWGAGLASMIGEQPVHTLSKLIAKSSAWTLLTFSLPPLICRIIVRDRLLTAAYVGIVAGIVLFAELFRFAGYPRHFGFIFVALVAVVWIHRSRPDKSISSVWIGILAINALGGFTTLVSEVRQYSHARHVAWWIERQGLAEELLIGFPDMQTVSVSGYLRRPIYSLECECLMTYREWSRARTGVRIPKEEFADRLERALRAGGKDWGYLIFYDRASLGARGPVPNLSFTRLKHFKGALSQGNYVIYRATRKNSN